MSKYETYKSSGIDFLGDIPNHWERKRIKDVSDTIAGGTPDTGKEAYWEGDIPWLPSGKVQNCIINQEDADTFITELGLKNSATKMLPYPSVLVALTGATCSNIGYLTFDACANQSVVGMPGSKQLNPSYLFYTLQSQKEQILLHQTGGAQGGISERNVKFLFIPLPTPVEQVTIANYLDHQTQKIDRLITNKKAQADKLKELRQIEINNAVTKGLNPNAELKDSGIDWLGKIPKNWKTNRLKNVTYINQEVITEKTSPDYELKYIDIGNVTSNGEFLELQEMTFSEAPSRARRKPKHNSIILSTVRTYLRAIAFVQNPDDNLIASTGFAVIDAYENLFDAKYLFYQMTSHIVVERVIANSDGVSYPAISSTKLGDMKIILPPKEEQELISKYLEDRTTAIDKLIKNIDAQIEKLQEVRKIKIYEAVTGKIKVNAYVEATA